MNVDTTGGFPGAKCRITIHIDGLTYRVLTAYATMQGERTANHAVFRIVVEAVRRLRAECEWAADIYNEARIEGLNREV